MLFVPALFFFFFSNEFWSEAAQMHGLLKMRRVSYLKAIEQTRYSSQFGYVLQSYYIFSLIEKKMNSEILYLCQCRDILANYRNFDAVIGIILLYRYS